jgi:uncharacterized protein YcfJ
MKSILKWLLGGAAAALALQASADVTFYEHENFDGRAFTAQEPVGNLKRLGFNDRASSVVVTGGSWEVCGDRDFRGSCIVLRPGNYASLQAMNLNDRVSSARPVGRERRGDSGRYAPQPGAGQITFFEDAGFQGRSFVARGDVDNFARYGFGDRASSAMVLGERWEACTDANFGGRCIVLRPGRYPDLASMGLNDRLSSVREVQATARFDDGRYAPPPAPAYDWRQRHGERLYQVDVQAVHAVFGQPQQRCWVERQQVVRDRPNVGGAIVGGVVGGILGHQIGGGTGRDIATVGGAVAGAAIGANVGRDGPQVASRDVQRCASTPASGRPDYWDVAYNFRGAEHHVQMTSPPGPTLTVNERGEPRL